MAAMLHGKLGALKHIAGLGVSGALLLAWLWLFRGSPVEILAYFRESSMYYNALSTQFGRDIAGERWINLKLSFRATMWLMPTAVLGLAWFFSPGRERRTAKVVAVLLILAPIPEIFTKLCGPYHWAQLLLGITFLGAMGLSWMSAALESLGKRRVTVGAYFALTWLVGELDARVVFRSYREGFRLSRQFGPVMLLGKWNDPSVETDMLLKTAKYVRETTRPEDHILESGNNHVLYPLSGRLPPSALATDLVQMSAMEYPRRRPELIEMLRSQPPRLVIEALNYKVALTDYWPDFGSRYRLVKWFPENVGHAGNGLRVWKLED